MSSNNQYTANAMARAFRILAALIALIGFAWSHAHAQIPLTGAGRGAPASGFTPSCTESSNFIARTSGLDTTHKTRYDTLICGLVTDGLCCAATGGVLDGLYIFATADTTTAKLNLTQNAYNLTQTGSLTFSADHGYTGDASTGFLDTAFTNTSVGNFVQNSASIGCYVLSNRAVTQTWAAMGYVANAQDSRLQALQGAGPGGLLYEIVDGGGANFDATATNAQGSFVITRTGGTTSAAYKNSNSTAFSTSVHVSAGISAGDPWHIYIFASDNTGTAANFTGDQQSACFMGAGMTNTQSVNLMNRLNTYMTAYGINVY